MEQIETENWTIFPLEDSSPSKNLVGSGVIDLRFKVNGRRDNGEIELTENEEKNLKEDLQDMGKWRKFKRLRRDLEDE